MNMPSALRRYRWHLVCQGCGHQEPMELNRREAACVIAALVPGRVKGLGTRCVRCHVGQLVLQ